MNCENFEFDTFRIQNAQNVNVGFHLHYGTEIILVKTGELKVLFKDKELVLHEGDGTIMLPYEIHGYVSKSYNEAVIIEFDKLVIDELTIMEIFSQEIFHVSPNLLNYTASVILNKRNSLIYIKSVIYPILNEIISEKNKSDVNTMTDESDIFRAAIKYIEENFRENISLRKASESIKCSYEYLSHLFRKSAGMSFTSYLNRYRIYSSLSNLVKTKKTITEISSACGFETLRSYNRSFKSIFGMTPTEYRHIGYSLTVDD